MAQLSDEEYQNFLKSNGWFTPSESLYKVFGIPQPSIIYPDDCGKPHNWERFQTNHGCQCSMCEQDDIEEFLECSECLTTWANDSTIEFDKAWDAASWG